VNIKYSLPAAFVVDDKEAALAALKAVGVKPIDGWFLDFRAP
jgi:hypothetical protein